MKRKPNGHYSCFGTKRAKTVILMLGILVLAQNISFENLALYGRDEKGSQQYENDDSIGIRSAEAQLAVGDSITSNVDNREIAVVSISSRYDLELGSFHIIGELVNNLDTSVKISQLNVTFYDAEGNVLGAATGSPYIEYLRSQERSAFDIAVYGEAATKVSGFSYYRISKSWNEVQESRPSLLDFSLRDITIDACGDYHFLGVVTNYGNVPASGIVLSAAFYNDQNQITESALTSVIGIEGNLQPAKQGSFELLVDDQILSQFSYYSFNVQSAEYISTVLEETGDPKSEEYLDYQNGSPVLGLPAGGNSVMTVTTNLTSYEMGPAVLGISGMVPGQDGVRSDNENRNLYVLIELLTPYGSVLDRIAAPISQDGSFLTTLPFSAEEGSEGKVYRIRAEYNGTVAENNFLVRSRGVPSDGIGQGEGDNSSPLADCEPVYIVINQLGWIPEDQVLDDNEIANGTIGNYLERPPLSAGSPVLLSVSAENKLNRLQPITAVIQVSDANGTAIFLQLSQSMLSPNSKYEVKVPWTPDIKGQYTIESFVISGLDEPRVLTRSLRTSLNIA